MKSPSEDIITILNESSEFNFDEFFPSVGAEPAEPSETVTIFDTGGYPPQLTFDREEDYLYHSIQILVRSAAYSDGWSMAESIREYLHGRANIVVGGTLYTLIKAFTPVFLLDMDNNQRIRFVINFNIQRRKV